MPRAIRTLFPGGSRVYVLYRGPCRLRKDPDAAPGFRLDRDVPKEYLDLLQFFTGYATPSPSIRRRDDTPQIRPANSSRRDHSLDD
jgi:hypothetical protein